MRRCFRIRELGVALRHRALSGHAGVDARMSSSRTRISITPPAFRSTRASGIFSSSTAGRSTCRRKRRTTCARCWPLQAKLTGAGSTWRSSAWRSGRKCRFGRHHLVRGTPRRTAWRRVRTSSSSGATICARSWPAPAAKSSPSCGARAWRSTRSTARSLLFYTGDTDRGLLESCDAAFRAEVLLIECSFILDGHQDRAAQYRHIHIDDIADFADRFENELIVLTHFSRRYSNERSATACGADCRLRCTIACAWRCRNRGSGCRSTIFARCRPWKGILRPDDIPRCAPGRDPCHPPPRTPRPVSAEAQTKKKKKTPPKRRPAATRQGQAETGRRSRCRWGRRSRSAWPRSSTAPWRAAPTPASRSWSWRAGRVGRRAQSAHAALARVEHEALHHRRRPSTCSSRRSRSRPASTRGVRSTPAAR